MYKAICKWPNGNLQTRDFRDEREATGWIIRIRSWCMRKSIPMPEAKITRID